MDPGSSSDSAEDLFSIYDGKRFVFDQSSWSIVTLWRLLRRYGVCVLPFQGRCQGCRETTALVLY